MHAMILAAGYGKRLRPLTDTVPKPLVDMGGRPLLDHTLLRVAALGIRRVVINVHHLAEQIIAHVGDGSAYGLDVIWSQETVLMETGGGVCQALGLLGEAPFLAINGDVVWDMDLEPLITAFDPIRMDGLLGLVPVRGEEAGGGDFVVDDRGRLRRAGSGNGGWIYSGLQMLRPSALRDYPAEPFSLNRFYDDAMGRERLYGLPLEGFWADIGTPERLDITRLEWKNRFAIGAGLAYKD
ncbi:MAG: nucleotidyltransferase family protein [Magnetococcales bacterium]|nr:nucleotidyltransferase family protein [Magnetococcales bacterium]